jgi:hypothetical protein
VIVFKGGGRSSSGNRGGTGKSFRGLTSYLVEGHREKLNPERVAWTSYRNLDGLEDPKSAATAMRAHAQQNARVERPAYHFGLSLSEGEHLTREQWEEAVDRVLRSLGLAEHQAVFIAHRDTAYAHVHVIVNRVGPDFRAWNARGDMVRANAIARELERDHGLLRLGGRALPPPAISPHAYQEARRTSQPPFADRVRAEAGPALAAATSWRELQERLAAQGFRLARASHGSGLVVTDGERQASLSRIDRTLSGPRLAARFGETYREYLERNEPLAAAVPQGRPGAGPPTLLPIQQRAEVLVERLAATSATFTRSDLHRAAFYDPERPALLAAALRSERLISLGRDSSGALRYTTHEYLDAETRLLSSAARLAGRGDLRLEAGIVARCVERTAPHLSDEQRAAVLHATTHGDLAQIIGRAGTGKTTVARAVAAAYQEQGYEVRGAALAGKAAEGLRAEIGVPSRTLASLEQAWNEGRDRLHAGSVLLIDEAGMVDARQLGRVLAHADQQSAKVVLLGDPDQLKAIGAGDAYRGLLERHPSVNLEDIRRQHEPWQRAASRDLAHGHVGAALDAYESAGRLHWSVDRQTAHTALVAAYLGDRAAAPEASRLVIAYRNDDVLQLNAAIRSARGAAGELGPGIGVAGVEYSAGDRLLFLRNDPVGRQVVSLDSAAPAGVHNGTLGTIEEASSSRFTVRLDDGRRVAFNPAEYNAIAHGYAVTIHKSQGATVDRVYALVDPRMDRNTAYVALTRHRDEVHVYADHAAFPGRYHLDKALSREGRKDLACDYAAADLHRVAMRITAHQESAGALERELGSLQGSIATLERVEATRGQLELSRGRLEEAAGRVYVDPAAATRALLADPAAAERLAAGEGGRYGELRGHDRPVLGRDPARTTAERRAAGLGSPLHLHRQTESLLARQLAGAATITGGLAELRSQLRRVSSALDRARYVAQGPERALELLVRHLGSQTVRMAVALLPPPVRVPVELVVRAMTAGLDRTLDLGPTH